MSVRIDSATPYSSVRTGKVPVFIDGRDFLSSDISSDFSAAPFYVHEVAFGGSVSLPSPDGIKLTVDSQVNSHAGIVHGTLFGQVFDISVDVKKTIATFPSVKNVVIFGLRASDSGDSSTYSEITIRYSDKIGYFSRFECRKLNEIIKTDDRAIGPYEVESIRLFRTQAGFTGYLKIGDDWLEVGQAGSMPVFQSAVSVYSSNFGTMVVGNFSIWLKRFNVNFAVSFANYPTILRSLSDTAIEILTMPGAIGAGKLALGLTDGSDYIWPGIVIYTQDEAVKRLSLFFDTAISAYQEYASPTREELFLSAGGFVWDQDEFVVNQNLNNNLFTPSLWDPKTYNINVSEFQSGYSFGDAIKPLEIVRYRNNGQEKWHAKINHGSYFINNSKFYLYSGESVTTRLEAKYTQDGRSLQNLLFLPKKGVPISVSLLTTDARSGNIVDKIKFTKRVKFTGVVRNGIELDSSNPQNIDKNFYEFKVIYNSNNQIKNWKIPSTGAVAGIYSFQLPKLPLEEYSLIFSRKDIFKNQKSDAKKYGDELAVYGNFKYGTGPQEPGDWSVNYFNGVVSVWLDRSYIDIGFVSFTWDYPAKIELNKDYLKNYGYGITNPEIPDLASLDSLGESTGELNQVFRCSEFPIYDLTYERYLDINNFKLFLYDPSSLLFDIDWRRIDSLKNAIPGQKVYELDADAGTITFGNGVQGAIPPKYLRLYAGYKRSLRIEYEPESSIDYWLAKNVDLNLSRNNLNAGFLHLTRKEQIPNSISLEFADSEINALEFSTLNAVVYDLEGEPMAGVPVYFETGPESGFTEEEVITSNSDGKASTVFLPNGNIEAMGIFVQLYSAGVNPSEPGGFLSSSLQNDGLRPNAKLIAQENINDLPEEVYLFKILDAGDPFTPYDNATRKGGTYQVYYKYDEDLGQNILVRPTSVSGRVLTFSESLPQSHDETGENYEPDLRGFCIVAKKTVKAVAKTSYKGVNIQSQAAELIIGYSPIQKGDWTLPVLPALFNGAEIDRATYITINNN